MTTQAKTLVNTGQTHQTERSGRILPLSACEQMSCECYLLDTILMQAYAAGHASCCEMPRWRERLGTGSDGIRTAGRKAASRGQAAQVGRRAWDSLNTSTTLVTNNGGRQHTGRIRMQRALEHGLDT